MQTHNYPCWSQLLELLFLGKLALMESKWPKHRLQWELTSHGISLVIQIHWISLKNLARICKTACCARLGSIPAYLGFRRYLAGISSEFLCPGRCSVLSGSNSSQRAARKWRDSSSLIETCKCGIVLPSLERDVLEAPFSKGFKPNFVSSHKISIFQLLIVVLLVLLRFISTATDSFRISKSFPLFKNAEVFRSWTRLTWLVLIFLGENISCTVWFL